tara:strand:+ start:1787 stop:1957 length:171 start_codon:yes stop_codon:yes gene_type:complete
MKNKNSSLALGAGMGLLVGVVIGAITDNIGLWIPLGLCLGAGVGLALGDKSKKKTD